MEETDPKMYLYLLVLSDVLDVQEQGKDFHPKDSAPFFL